MRYCPVMKLVGLSAMRTGTPNVTDRVARLSMGCSVAADNDNAEGCYGGVGYCTSSG